MKKYYKRVNEMVEKLKQIREFTMSAVPSLIIEGICKFMLQEKHYAAPR